MQTIVTDVRGVRQSVCHAASLCVGHSVQSLSNHFGLLFDLQNSGSVAPLAFNDVSYEVGYKQQEDQPPRDSARRFYLPYCLPGGASLADHPASNLGLELSGV